MKISRAVSACLMVLASAGMSQAEVSQHFDRSGSLVPAGKKLTAPQAQRRMRKYSVPEGIELRPDVRYEFYPVFGKTFAEIVKSTEENSPRNEKTKKRQSSAYDWNLGWTYDFSFSLEPDEEDEKVHCDFMIVDPILSYDITVTLPALTDDSALNPMEKDLWKNYVATLLERVHGRIKIIKDDTKDVILRQFGEITYLFLNEEEAVNAEKIVERFVRAETERIGSNIIRQIQQKLEAYDSNATQDIGDKPAKAPSEKSTTP
jgi:predicted secreted Zn-dependent protease